MVFDLTSTRLVLAGNAYGECSSGGRIGMENVTSVVLTRWHAGWARTLIEVCLAPAQFSCWTDVNRHRIEAAAGADPRIWALALAVADAALAGTLPVRTNGADSYYALSMAPPACWAAPPAHHVYADRWHSFWSVRRQHAPPVPGVPNISVQAGAATAADALDDAELIQLGVTPLASSPRRPDAVA